MGDLKLGLFDTPGFGGLLGAPARPRKNRETPIWRLADGFGGKVSPKGGGVPQGPMARLSAVIKKHPEVMVKITGTNKIAGTLKAHLSYLQRRADGDIEDERGVLYEANAATVERILKQWGVAVEEGHENEREALPEDAAAERQRNQKTIAVHIVLSMPKHTNAAAVMRAARGFAGEELQNHQHLLVLHTDKDHPHVHIVVNNIGNDLQRLPRRREDMQRWREVFARELKSQGIEAAATPRKARGVLVKGESAEVWHGKRRMQNERASSSKPASKTMRVFQAQVEQAANELRGAWTHVDSAAELRARKNRADYEIALKDATAKLQSQGEQGSVMARQVAEFLRHLPAPETALDVLKRELSEPTRTRTPAPLDSIADGGPTTPSRTRSR